MKEKFNNKAYIYTNLKLWYEQSDDKVYKEILKPVCYTILENIFFVNISLKDLKKFIALKEKLEKTPFNNVSEINKEISKLINKNTDIFLKNSYDIIENIIY